MGSFSQHFSKLPKSIQSAVNLIIKELNPSEVILFGSRARGDQRENSDFDIAVKIDIADPTHWSKVQNALSEDPITLFPIDLVDFAQMPLDYQLNISREGVSLYVR